MLVPVRMCRRARHQKMDVDEDYNHLNIDL